MGKDNKHHRVPVGHCFQEVPQFLAALVGLLIPTFQGVQLCPLRPVFQVLLQGQVSLGFRVVRVVRQARAVPMIWCQLCQVVQAALVRQMFLGGQMGQVAQEVPLRLGLLLGRFLLVFPVVPSVQGVPERPVYLLVLLDIFDNQSERFGKVPMVVPSHQPALAALVFLLRQEVLVVPVVPLVRVNRKAV